MANTFSNLLFHVVFSTKQRLPLIQSNFQEELHCYIGGIVKAEGGTSLGVGGVADHVHILMKLKPTHSVAEMVKFIKSNSSRWLNETKFELRKFGWQEGYSAFTVSESQVAAVQAYIRNQEQHHRQQTFFGRAAIIVNQASNHF